MNVAYANGMRNDLLPTLEKLTPNDGAYINEADFRQLLQNVFYRTKCPKLRKVKSSYELFDLFYAVAAVGSEDEYKHPRQGGRLSLIKIYGQSATWLTCIGASE